MDPTTSLSLPSTFKNHSKPEPCTAQPTPEDTLRAKPDGREKKSWGREKTTSHFPEGDQIPISDKSGTGGRVENCVKIGKKGKKRSGKRGGMWSS
jgi:hypothetical protein